MKIVIHKYVASAGISAQILPVMLGSYSDGRSSPDINAER